MKRVRNLLFGVGMFAALGIGAGAAVAEAQPATAAAMRVCGWEQDEGGCRLCCQVYGLDYAWDDEFGCGCV